LVHHKIKNEQKIIIKKLFAGKISFKKWWAGEVAEDVEFFNYQTKNINL